MASEGGDTPDLAEGTHEPRECMACRGTGRVISNLGGSPSALECPWCAGTGLRPAEIDAQARWLTADQPAGSGEDTGGETEPEAAEET